MLPTVTGKWLPFGCVQLAHPSLSDCNDIFVNHHFIVIILEVSIFPILAIFSVVMCMGLFHDVLSSVTYVSREQWDTVSISDVQSPVCANDRVYYVLRVVFFCCTLRYLIIIIMQIYPKALDFWNAYHVYVTECASKIKSIPSIIFYSIYRSKCLPLTQSAGDDRENMDFINIKFPIWIINLSVGIGQE